MNKVEPLIYPGTRLYAAFYLLVITFLIGWFIYVIYQMQDSSIGYSDYSLIPLILTVPTIILCLLWLPVLRIFMKEKSSLEVNQDGLSYPPFIKQIGTAEVSWDALSRARLSILSPISTIKITLENRQQNLIEKLPKNQRILYGKHLVVHSDALSGDGKEICSTINKFIHNNRMQSDAAEPRR